MEDQLKIGIVDADLIGRKNHRFPNLACEKISAYWKKQGACVELCVDYGLIDQYDQVYISRVFTDTPFPDWIVESERVHLGGTGFFFDRAPDLPCEIEHVTPDYDLYNDWIEGELQKAEAEAERQGRPFRRAYHAAKFKEYTDYSIGFMTRGCFRKCKFCVNQKYDRVFPHSELGEFLSADRKKICLLDDNFLGCSNWREMLDILIATGKPFKFKQGLDERLLTEEKCKILFNSKYDGDWTFAFDNISDYDLIHEKLKMIRRYTKSTSVKFYVLVGFEGVDITDIENAFKRIKLLLEFGCLPYIMRYQDKDYSPWKDSQFRSLYVALARWCNQPRIVKKMSFRQFCEANQALHKTEGTFCSCMQAMMEIERDYPEVASRYFDIRFVAPGSDMRFIEDRG